MSSHNSESKFLSNSILVRLGLLIGIGLILFLFESLIPRPLPWMKPGLGHIATLLALYTIDNRAALIVVIGRIFLGSIILGTFLNVTFFLSFFGGVTSTVVMIFLKKHFPEVFSIFGISISGAVTHNFIQLILVECLIVNKIELFYLLPIITISSIFTGFIVALASHLLISKF